jgi:type I restriction enzyme S subunit
MAGEWLDREPFPLDWRMYRLGDLAEVKGGKRLPAGYALVPTKTNHPYLRVVDFKDGRIDKSGLLYVPDEVFPRVARYTISSKDIYISIVGTIGLAGIVDDELDGANLTENAVKICNITPKVERDYLVAFLRSEWGQHQIRSFTVGSTQPKLAIFRIADIQIPLPPLSEQRAIAHILGTLDDKIELNRRINETLEQMARALFKSWFVDFEPVCAKMEGRWKKGQSLPGLPAHLWNLFPDRLVDSELCKTPKGWEVKGLDQIAHFLNGLALQKYPPQGECSLPVIKIAQLRTGTTQGADRAGADLPPEYIVNDGDVLFSWSGSLECVLWVGGEGALNQHIFKVTSEQYPKWFYFFWIQEHLPEFRYIAADKATTMGHIQRHHLTEAKVVVATPPVMGSSNRIMKTLFDQIVGIRLESSTLAALRDALLPKLISGEIRVKDVERFLKERGL